MGSVQPQIRAGWAVGTWPAWGKGSTSDLASPEVSQAVFVGFQHPGLSVDTEGQPRAGAGGKNANAHTVLEADSDP